MYLQKQALFFHFHMNYIISLTIFQLLFILFFDFQLKAKFSILMPHIAYNMENFFVTCFWKVSPKASPIYTTVLFFTVYVFPLYTTFPLYPHFKTPF